MYRYEGGNLVNLKKRFKSEKTNESELTFSNIDEPLRNFLAKSLVMLGISLLTVIMIGIIFKQMKLMLFCTLVIAAFLIYILSIISKALNSKVIYYEGICSEVHKKIKKNPLDVNYIVIKNVIDDSYMRFVPHEKKELSYKEGDTIRVYSACSEKALIKLENVYTIPSYYLSACIKRGR